MEIDEIDHGKYIVIKRDDMHLLTKEDGDKLSVLIHKIYDARISEGKQAINTYLVLNMVDTIDLSIWSPILKRLEAIRDSHKVLVYQNKSGSRKEFNHDMKHDYVKDVAVSIVNAILKTKGK